MVLCIILKNKVLDLIGISYMHNRTERYIPLMKIEEGDENERPDQINQSFINEYRFSFIIFTLNIISLNKIY